MSAEVPPGYKQTEVGVIPEDWNTNRLGDFCACFSGGTPSTSNPNYYNGEIPWITSSDLNLSRITEVDGRITGEGLANSSAKTVKAGTLLLALYGATAGVAAVTEIDAAINQAVLAIQPRKHEIGYLFEFLRLRKDFLIKTYTQGGQPNFSGEIVKSFLVPLPPTKLEQQRIAEALSDADALIEGLGQLIGKKLEVKQGAMQELLSGRKRLSQESISTFKNSEIGEIPSDWHVAEIGDIANVKTGPFGSSLHEHDYVEDGTPIITVEHLGKRGITYSNLPKVSEKDWKRLNAYSLQENDIVFSRVGSVDRNAFVSKAEQGWLFSGRLLRVRRLSSEIDTKYLSYHFHSEPFKNRVRTVAVGQTMASLNTQILKSVFVVLPPRAEQTEIATILSDMDAEIAGLEVKLDKARRVKEGMMQDLLTGKVRLV